MRVWGLGKACTLRRVMLQGCVLQERVPRNGSKQVAIAEGGPCEYRITLITLLLYNPCQPQAT